jgi:hypothetical protein
MENGDFLKKEVVFLVLYSFLGGPSYLSFPFLFYASFIFSLFLFFSFLLFFQSFFLLYPLSVLPFSAFGVVTTNRPSPITEAETTFKAKCGKNLFFFSRFAPTRNISSITTTLSRGTASTCSSAWRAAEFCRA